MDTTPALTNISKQLITAIPALKDPGLLYGKMGIVIFFFHYARYTADESYENLGMGLIDAIQQDINMTTPVNYASGLSGIGAGIEYLFQEGFVSGNSDEILEEFDKKISYTLVHTDYFEAGLEKGLCGIGRYLLYRIDNRTIDDENIALLTNRQNLVYILDLLDYQKQLYSADKEDILLFLWRIYAENIFNFKVEKLIRYYMQDDMSDINALLYILSSIAQKDKGEKIKQLHNIEMSTALPLKTGLKDGYTGLGLELLSTLERQHESWCRLI